MQNAPFHLCTWSGSLANDRYRLPENNVKEWIYFRDTWGQRTLFCSHNSFSTPCLFFYSPWSLTRELLGHTSTTWQAVLVKLWWAVAFLPCCRKSWTRMLISSFRFSQINKLQSTFTIPKTIRAKISHRLFTVATQTSALEGAQSGGKAAAHSANGEQKRSRLRIFS